MRLTDTNEDWRLKDWGMDLEFGISNFEFDLF